MAVENTLAYYDTATIMAPKGFIEQTPGLKASDPELSSINEAFKS
jgi:hypothetical protein